MCRNRGLWVDKISTKTGHRGQTLQMLVPVMASTFSGGTTTSSGRTTSAFHTDGVSFGWIFTHCSVGGPLLVVCNCKQWPHTHFSCDVNQLFAGTSCVATCTWLTCTMTEVVVSHPWKPCLADRAQCGNGHGYFVFVWVTLDWLAERDRKSSPLGSSPRLRRVVSSLSLWGPWVCPLSWVPLRGGLFDAVLILFPQAAATRYLLAR